MEYMKVLQYAVTKEYKVQEKHRLGRFLYRHYYSREQKSMSSKGSARELEHPLPHYVGRTEKRKNLSSKAYQAR